jgi:hypothetical protein
MGNTTYAPLDELGHPDCAAPIVQNYLNNTFWMPDISKCRQMPFYCADRDVYRERWVLLYEEEPVDENDEPILLQNGEAQEGSQFEEHYCSEEEVADPETCGGRPAPHLRRPPHPPRDGYIYCRFGNPTARP